MYKSKLFGQINAKTDLADLSGSQLAELYNEVAESTDKAPVKKFSDRKTGIRHTWALIEALPRETVEEHKEDTPKPRAVAGMLMLEKAPVIKPHKPKTNRGRVIALTSREGGASLQELMKETGWDRAQVRASLRQINQYNGHGVVERPANHFTLLGDPLERKRMNYAPAEEIKVHREGTKRAKALAMLLEGTTFEAVMEACEWDEGQAYEGIKLLNGYLGYGIEEQDDGTLRAYTK